MRLVKQPLVALLLAFACLLTLGSHAYGQNTIGGDEFPPGVADFPQSGSEVGRGAAFQFSSEDVFVK